jgi:hypothetical protein
MPGVLAATKFFWEVIKAGKPVVGVSDQRVNVLPDGLSKNDLPGPWETTSYTEYLREYSMLGEWAEELGIPGRIVDYSISAVWDYNGQYISDFHISASGTVQVFTDLDVAVQTFDADFDSDDVVQMNYDIICTINNLTGGSRRLVIHAVAQGNGGGMSLGID